MRGRTTLLISHRYEMARRADRVVVVDGARIVEQGAPEALAATAGAFSALFATDTERPDAPAGSDAGPRRRPAEGPLPLVRYRLDKAPFDSNGDGVRVAIIDSGINTDNPHITAYASGVAIDRDGGEHDDVLDRIGHGTAVAAAIQEKAPGAELHVVRVFETSLSTSAANLARAIDWAATQRLQIANLSLGTPRREHAELLRDAVLRAPRRGPAGGLSTESPRHALVGREACPRSSASSPTLSVTATRSSSTAQCPASA